MGVALGHGARQRHSKRVLYVVSIVAAVGTVVAIGVIALYNAGWRLSVIPRAVGADHGVFLIPICVVLLLGLAWLDSRRGPSWTREEIARLRELRERYERGEIFS